MKKEIHPNYHKITVQLTDGSSFKTKSTYGKEGDILKLDIDPLTHPAWTKEKRAFINENVSKVAKFNKRFGGISFTAGATAKKDESKADKKDDK